MKRPGSWRTPPWVPVAIPGTLRAGPPVNSRWYSMTFVLVLSALGVACPADEKPVAPVHVPAVPPPVRRAQLKGLQGDVKVKRAAGDEWLPAQEGMALFENDKVRTVAAGVVTESDWREGSSNSASTRPRKTVRSVRSSPGRGRVSAMPISASSPRFTTLPLAKTI